MNPADIEPMLQEWLAQYGLNAVPVALLWDPAGVPWAWIFLMLLASEGGLNVPLMLLYGYLVLLAADHALYWIGSLGGTRLLGWLAHKRPTWRTSIEGSCEFVSRRGALAVVLGRFVPLVGRWAPLGAGMSRLPYVRFAVYECIGAALTVWGFGIVAYLIGRRAVEHPYFYQIIVLGFVIATLFGVASLLWGWWRQRAGASASSQPQSKAVEPSN